MILRNDVIAAASKILQESVPYYVDPDAIAAHMLRAAMEKYFEGQVYAARMKDGRFVDLKFIDKLDYVPGYDKMNNRYEALTSWFRVTFRDGERKEDYSQVDRMMAEDSGNIVQYRKNADTKVLDRMGVDVSSFDLWG